MGGVALAERIEVEREPEEDHRVILHGVTWEQYSAILAIRGDRAGPRMSYLKGELELMSPSITHETKKTLMARLVEAYAEEMGLSLNGYGSWTIRKKKKERGVEPDECYVLGTQEVSKPDLAFEVIWTSGGIDKLEIYRGLGVREVWVWRKGRIEVYVLRGEEYERVPRSELLPDLDLVKYASYLEQPDQTRAVRAFRDWLRRSRSRRR